MTSQLHLAMRLRERRTKASREVVSLMNSMFAEPLDDAVLDLIDEMLDELEVAHAAPQKRA